MGEVYALSEKDTPKRASMGDRFSRTVLKLNTHLPLLIRHNFTLQRKHKLEEKRSQEKENPEATF